MNIFYIDQNEDGKAVRTQIDPKLFDDAPQEKHLDTAQSISNKITGPAIMVDLIFWNLPTPHRGKMRADP